MKLLIRNILNYDMFPLFVFFVIFFWINTYAILSVAASVCHYSSIPHSLHLQVLQFVNFSFFNKFSPFFHLENHFFGKPARRTSIQGPLFDRRHCLSLYTLYRRHPLCKQWINKDTRKVVFWLKHLEQKGSQPSSWHWASSSVRFGRLYPFWEIIQDSIQSWVV